ncbi:MAG: double-cubane-cluster-containing anaerobic reductase [Acidobacteriota bacterium]|nr:double-cubane-cluster-containing anaerobic reductase [Acidobacteriota bacterium]
MSEQYRAMWEKLGIDMPAHDLLMQALPDIYKKVYLGQKNRPQAMVFYDFVVSEIHGLRVKELVDHREKGGKVFGTFCVYVPEEVIVAGGGICVGLCAGADFSVPTGERIVPRNLCALIKSAVGFKAGNVCPYFQVADLVVGETTCDGKKKTWEILDEYIPTYVMDLPNSRTAADRDLWISELKRFVAKVEETTGNSITPKKLAEATSLINSKREVLQRLYDLRKARPAPISGLDALLAVQISFYDDPARFVQKTDELCDELENRIQAKQGVASASAKRILYSGTPMPIPFWTIPALIEQTGAVVVAEESCTGTRLLAGGQCAIPDGGLEAQLAALADRQLQTNCACFTPNDARIEDILRLAKEYQADGVIHFSLSFCQPYNLEGVRVQKALQKAGVPVLLLEGDYSDEQAGQLKTRIEAFIETL